ncbi:hypothetical protein D210916BOD24_15210 [Alteromonas sp. D210916BOD_24]|uniref:PAS domain S-box protein n=1 Tax=Alteromonas sp. D210916BOD_24 TaxID=3157618 RepID=UPI00399CCBDE
MGLKQLYRDKRRRSQLNLDSAWFALDQHSLVSITDIDGTIVYANQKFCLISGYSEDELIGKNHSILNSGAQDKAYWKNMHDTVLAGNVWHDEVRNRAKDGTYYWVDTTIVPNVNTSGEVLGFTSIRTDITKQKLINEQLTVAKEQAEAAKFALDQHSLVSIANLDGTITYVNARFEEVSGYSKKELIGRKHNILNSGLQPKAYWQKMHGTVLSGEVWRDEVRNRAKNGSFYWVETTIVPNYTEKGDINGFTSIRTDITEQKEHIFQVAVAKQQAEAAKFALDQHSLVSIADADGTITYVNERFEKVSGYTKEELIGKKHNILNSGLQPKAYWQKMHGTVLSGKVWHDEVRNRNKDGRFYWVDTTIVPNFNTNDEVVGFTSIRTDITQQKLNIEQLNVAKQKAELANTAKANFLANMSHEIRTPMNGVYGSLQLLNNESLTKKATKNLNNALLSVRSLMTIVDDILDFSKIEAGKLSVEKTNFNLSELLENIISDFTVIAVEKGISITANNDLTHDEWVGDPIRIRQILINIISNSLKFTKKGSITVTLSHDEHKGDLIFQIIDTGIGMSSDALNKLFERFEQADTSITRKYGGTGIGMSITKSLTQLMGGNIDVQSEVEVGTRFTVRLPLSKADIPISKLEIVELEPNEYANSNILLVEDNEINQLVAISMLEDTSANVVVANNGQHALEVINKDIDLVLMDIQMPIMDGFEAIKKLKKRNINIPVIALTANVMLEDIKRYKEAGFVDCIAKPIEKRELLSQLQKYLKN